MQFKIAKPKKVAVEPHLQDIFIFACFGSIVGSITTYYLNNSVKLRTLGVLVGGLSCGIGQYIYKKRNPDTIDDLDFNDVIATVAAFLDKKENNFPVVDLHTPNSDNRFHERGQMEQQKISLYQSVMDRRNITSLPKSNTRIQAWMQIRQLYVNHHQQQISKLPSNGWRKHIST